MLYQKIPVITRSGATYAAFSEVLYIEKYRRLTRIHTFTKIYQMYQPLSEIYESLDDRFFKCHSSMIVNFQNVKDISDGHICFKNGQRVFFGRNTYLDTRRGYTAYLQNIVEIQRKIYRNTRLNLPENEIDPT